MTDLGTLGGPVRAAYGINDLGQVVGASETASGDGHAFRWEAGVMIDMGTLPGGTESVARGINDLGQVVGRSRTASGDFHAVLWTTPRQFVLSIDAAHGLHHAIAVLQGLINPHTALADKIEDAIHKAQAAWEELMKTPPDNQAAVNKY